MPFFKILSDNPEDYELDDNQHYIPDSDSDPDFEIETETYTGQEHLEILLDTGELFSVPLDWLIQASRYYSFQYDTDHKGDIH